MPSLRHSCTNPKRVVLASTLFLCRERLMPKYKNPLYIQASQYLGGFYAETMSARELQELENNLLEGLDIELALVTEKIWQIFDQLNTLEKIRAAAREEIGPRYLALVNIFLRAIRVKCRLVRTHHKIMSEFHKRNDLYLFAFELSPPPALEINSLLRNPSGSSQKIKFFYS